MTTLRVGGTVTVDVERPAVGGRMIARHDGRVVFVAGAIPGERVEVRIERIQRQIAWAQTTGVVTASPDRVDVPAGLTCGGQVLAHVSEARQRSLKAEMLADALRRIGKLTLDAPVVMTGGPADGYRTRARVHIRAGRAGFFTEGSHHLCALAPSRQLAPASVEVIERLTVALAGVAADAEAELEWAEDATGEHRIAHVAVGAPRLVRAVSRVMPLPGLDGLSVSAAGDNRIVAPVWGETRVVDRVVATGDVAVGVGHSARAFFQGNRHLLQPLVDEVLGHLEGPVLDLYAGVGLFALAAAAAGLSVTAVEGDEVSAVDLVANASAAPTVTAVHAAVEAYLAGASPGAGTVIVDPPRTGLSPAAVAGLIGLAPARLVYVSCDPATLARDVRRCLDAGYRLSTVRGFDLFPRTGHVEAVVTLRR
jgi:23S rRNA (uracil1939-C5)-methyltransferase